MSKAIEAMSSGEPDRVTEDAVRWGYRMLLGRMPENDQVVREHCQTRTTVDDLREMLLSSNEFRASAKSVVPPQPSGFEPRLDIDRASDPAMRQRLLDHIAKGWAHYGETDAHWSVLTDERFRSDKVQENIDAFNALGDLHVKRFLATLARNGVSLPPGGHCIELGCGVGRLTRWLAPHFRRVTGLDVSPGHLALAQTYVSQHAYNVDFVQLNRFEQLEALPRAHAVFTFIVLQHNPPPVMEAILERIFDRLEPGGIAYFQLPTYIPGYRFDVKEYLRHYDGNLDMEMHALPQATVFEIAARHRMQPLEALGETTHDHVVAHYFLMRKV